MTSITQNMRFRQSLMKYAQRFGVARASRKYNKSRSYIYFWLKRYNGSIESLACQSRTLHKAEFTFFCKVGNRDTQMITGARGQSQQPSTNAATASASWLWQVAGASRNPLFMSVTTHLTSSRLGKDFKYS